MADPITITLPGLPSISVPVPPGFPALTPEQIAALQKQITSDIVSNYPSTLADLQAALKSGDFRQFNADFLKATELVLKDIESLYHPPAPCFTTGVLIRTERGEVAVEDLSVGDLVITSSGALRPITWIGHRAVDCGRNSRPREVMPVRISANAFGDNRPSRDLLVSPGHSICVDIVGEVLIPASSLINDTTIVQEQVDQITYWHVELDGGHNVLFAENLPCESYLEMENRSFFAQGDVVSLGALPDVKVITHDDFCRPFHVGGALVKAVSLRLMSRVADLGWHHEHVDITTCRVVADGISIEPQRRDMSLLFKVPAGASDVWLESSVGVPAALSSKSRDFRSLGVQVAGISIGDGFSSVSVMPDDPRLAVGFHKVETTSEICRRWTNGRAYLPSSLWDGLSGDLFIRVDVSGELLPRWVKSDRKPGLLLAA